MPTSPPERSSPRVSRSAREIRDWIVGEVAQLLNVAPAAVDPGAPLDSHGVDSLGAISMTGSLAAWLDRDVPATLMWDYATIDAIADGLADPDAQPVLPPGVIPFQPDGDRAPLFCFPGIGGHPVTFAALAAQLGASQPCFGLRVPGLDGETEPLDTIEAIAAAMVANVRGVQPTGPYQLAGYSFGGFLAYEAARQLTAAGEAVSTLAVYDAFAPAGQVVRPRWQRLAMHCYLLATHPGRLNYLRERLGRLRGVGFDEYEEPIDDASPQAAVRAVRDANLLALARYRPAPYAGTMTMFLARERPDYAVFYKLDATGGWGPLCAGGVRVVTLPGTHLTIFKGDHVRTNADALRPFLLDAREATRSIAA